MLYIRPDYYNKFKCTADKCEATCCAGWQIVIDDASLERYEKEQSAYGDVLRERIDWVEGVFKQDSCKRCAFLNPDNLPIFMLSLIQSILLCLHRLFHLIVRLVFFGVVFS